MLRKLHFWLAAVACVLCSAAYAQTEITDDYLSNAGFDDESSFTTGTDGTISTTASGNFYDVAEWTQLTSSYNGWSAVAAVEIGSGTILNNSTVPEVNAEGDSVGGVLGFSIGWDNCVQYGQEVTLAAGSYIIAYAVYNGNSSTSYALEANKTGFLASDGTSYYATTTSFTAGEWIVETVSFTLEEETTGNITVGFDVQGQSSTKNPVLFVDYVKLYQFEDTYVDCSSTAGTDWINGNTGSTASTYNGYTGYNDDVAREAYVESNVTTYPTLPLYKTISGLDAGEYVVSFYGTAQLAGWSGSGAWTDTSGSTTYSDKAYAFATTEGTSDFTNAQTAALTMYYGTSLVTGSLQTFTFTIDIEEGEDLTIGIYSTQDAMYANWFTAQLISLQQVIKGSEVVDTYEALVAEAEELLASEYLADEEAAAELEELISVSGITDYSTAINDLTAAIEVVQANVTTNETLANGESVSISNSSLDGWAQTMTNSTLQVNTWSTETDDSGVTTPFIEDWIYYTSSLSDGSIYYTSEDLLAGAYTVSGTIRVFSEAGNTPSGIVAFAGDATDNIAETGTQTTYSTSGVLYKTVSLTTRLSEVGPLVFGVNISSANFNWVAFKDFSITAYDEADKSALEAAIEASQAVYDGTIFGDNIYLTPVADGETYAEAIAAAQAVVDNITATDDEIAAAIAALQEADSVFAAVEVNQPSDTTLYIFQQTASGYYLSIDEESESTYNNIVLDDDEYPFYIVTSNDSVFLVSESGQYICHYGSNTWTMGTSTDGGSTGTVHSFTITPYEEVDSVVHYALVCAYNSLSVASDNTSVGSVLYDNKSVGTANGLWVISEYVYVEDPLGKKELLKAITASTSVYEAASVGTALFQYSEEGAAAYAEAIAAAQAVYDSEDEAQTADDVTAAIEALAAADEAFAAAVNVPVEGQLYTLQNKQTGYYLAVNDDATSTAGNIVMSSTDQEGWYISYDSSTGYSQIYNEAGEYLCYAGTNTWTMGTEGTTFDIGIIPTVVDDVYYYQLEVYVNSRTRIIGTYSDESDPATLYCDKVYSSIGDWGLWTIAEVEEEEADSIGDYEIVLTINAEVEGAEDINYTPSYYYYDSEAILAALGAESLDDLTFAALIDGELFYDYYTANYGYWLDSEGDVCSWGADDITFFVEYYSSGQLNVGQMPYVCEEGDVYTTTVYLLYGTSAVEINLTYTITEADAVTEDDYTIVGTEEITVYAEPYSDYTAVDAGLDLDAIAEALGCSSLDDATFAALTDEGITTAWTATYGYWMGSDGYPCNYADGSFYIEYYTSDNGYYVGIGQMPSLLSEGDSFTATIYFIYDDNAYKVTITFTINSDLATGISAISGSGNGTFDATNIYSLSGQLIRTQATSLEGLQQGIYIVNGQKVLVK